MDDVIIRAVVAQRSPTHATSKRASPFVVMKTAPQASVKHLWPAPPQVHTMLDSMRTVSTIIHTTMSNTGDYPISRLSDSRAHIVECIIRDVAGGSRTTIEQWRRRRRLATSTEDDEDILRLSERANWHSLALIKNMAEGSRTTIDRSRTLSPVRTGADANRSIGALFKCTCGPPTLSALIQDAALAQYAVTTLRLTPLTSNRQNCRHRLLYHHGHSYH